MTEITSARSAAIERNTKETRIAVSLTIEGTGHGEISTGVGFFDHMLDQLARHSLIDLKVEAQGDLHVDDHHMVEDTGIAIGLALARALAERAGITRYASLDLAMDETLTRAAIDVSGRPYLVWKVAFPSQKIGTFDSELVHEFFHALALNAGITLHVEKPLWRQQSSYRRDLFQIRGPGVAHGIGDRSAPGRTHSLDQGDIVMSGWTDTRPALRPVCPAPCSQGEDHG